VNGRRDLDIILEEGLYLVTQVGQGFYDIALSPGVEPLCLDFSRPYIHVLYLP